MKKLLRRLFNVFTIFSFVYLIGFIYNLIVDKKFDETLIGFFIGSLIFVGILNYLIQGRFTIWNDDVRDL